MPVFHEQPQRAPVVNVNHLMTPQRLLTQTQDLHDKLSEEAVAIEEQLGHLSARLREIDFMRRATAEVLDILSGSQESEGAASYLAERRP